MGNYFGEILQRALSRRDTLKLALFGGASLMVGGYSLAKSSKTLSFRTIYPNSEDKITLPDGFDHKVVIRWGDALDNGENLNWDDIYENGPTDQDIERQKNCFGYNCDFVGFLKAPNGKVLLAVNHEYTNPELMFKNFSADGRNPNPARPTANEAKLMLEAHG
ncbi:MAG: alkaline phosphatase PhoX, partial [Aquificaceae bacterium]